MLSSKLSTVLSAEDQKERAPREWPRFMTARVAADYCDTSPWTIRRNVVPCGRRGRSLVYAIDAVEMWMRGTALGGRNPVVITATRRPDDPPVAASLSRVRELRRSTVEVSGEPLEGIDGNVAA